MEGDPFVLIEGMTIAGLATGATQGYIYLRWSTRTRSFAARGRDCRRHTAGLLGQNIQGMPLALECAGSGAYICGEETSLLESLEGSAAGALKPPLPANSPGLRPWPARRWSCLDEHEGVALHQHSIPRKSRKSPSSALQDDVLCAALRAQYRSSTRSRPERAHAAAAGGW